MAQLSITTVNYSWVASSLNMTILPDFTPTNFFLWGYLKSRVYVNTPANYEELKQRIRDEINITAALYHLHTFIEECYGQDAQHMDNILFKY